MNDTKINVLDYEKNFGIPYRRNENPYEGCKSIGHLKEGLIYLYDSMQALEKEAYSEGAVRGEKPAFAIKLSDHDIEDSMAANFSFWYSVQILNYLKTLGTIKYLMDRDLSIDSIVGNKELISELKVLSNEYIDEIQGMEQVKTIRNKLGAHFAFSDPHNNDNFANIRESINLQLTYSGGRYRIGALSTSSTEKSKFSSFGGPGWSMTEHFESLRKRFFPQR